MLHPSSPLIPTLALWKALGPLFTCECSNSELPMEQFSRDIYLACWRDSGEAHIRGDTSTRSRLETEGTGHGAIWEMVWPSCPCMAVVHSFCNSTRTKDMSGYRQPVSHWDSTKSGFCISSGCILSPQHLPLASAEDGPVASKVLSLCHVSSHYPEMWI